MLETGQMYLFKQLILARLTKKKDDLRNQKNIESFMNKGPAWGPVDEGFTIAMTEAMREVEHVYDCYVQSLRGEEGCNGVVPLPHRKEGPNLAREASEGFGNDSPEKD